METVTAPVVPSPAVGRETIKEKELLPKVLSGGPLLVGEFRSQKVEQIKYLDQKTNKPAVFLKVTINLEVGEAAEPVAVEVRMPRDLTEPSQVSLGLVKGNRVAARLSSLRKEKGSTSASVEGPESLVLVV